MKKRLFLLIIILLIFTNPILTEGRTKKVRSIYTNLEFTSEFFPEYEIMTLSISVQRTIALNLNSTYELFMTSYRVVVNTTLLAYIDHKNNTENYIPELEKITLEFDKDEFELVAADYNYFHKLIVQVSAVGVDPAGVIHKIADDYITDEVFFAREATGKEVMQTIAIAFSPLIILFAIFFFRRRVDKTTFENVSYFSMFKHSIRKWLTRNYDHQEEVSVEAIEPGIKKEYLLYIFHAFILVISIVMAYLGSRSINTELVQGIVFYASSCCFLLIGVFSTIKLLRRSKPITDQVESETKPIPALNTKQGSTEIESMDSETLPSKTKKPFWRRLLRFDK